MLTLASRNQYRTLLDAIPLTQTDDSAVITFVATDTSPLVVTQQAFKQSVIGYANYLHANNIGPRDLVAIASGQSLAAIYAFWGALYLGAIPAMFPPLTEKLDPTVYRRQMAELVRLSGVHTILTDEAFMPELATFVGCPVLSLTHSFHTGNTSISPALTDPDEIAFLQHSSGTTGLQKGVALSHTAVLNQIAAYSEAIQLNQQDVVVSWLPLYHDMGLIAGFLLPLLQGIPLVLMSPFDWVQHPALLLRTIHEYSGTLCWLPNFAYNHCAHRTRRRDLADISLASMRLFINCSEPVRYDSHELFLNKFGSLGVTPAKLGVSYAMAENTFAVTQTTPNQPARVEYVDGPALRQNGYANPVEAEADTAVPLVSCGKPICGTAVRVVDGVGNVLPERRVGDVELQSDCMLTNYYRRSDLRPFRNVWYQTGDRGYLAGGELFVLGRSKDLIINAGKNVYPQDIEAIVSQVEGVYPGRVAAFGVADAREGTELIAVVAEVKTNDEAVLQQIRLAIRQQIARETAVTVSYIHLVAARWLIKTSSGKVARSANRDKWLAERSERTNSD